MTKGKYEKIMDIAKRRGFIWPSFEIHGGAAGFYDFGPLGSLLKGKLIQKWRYFYVIKEGFLEIDSPTVTPEPILKASGHVDHFTDAMSECIGCGDSFKVTELLEEQTGKKVEGLSNEELGELVKTEDIRCPNCNGRMGEVFDFNTMFQTAISPKEERKAYLRPETAQTIFVDFKRLQRIARRKLPFGVAQIGKGYRNEISPRRGIIRLREFTMAEAEVFFDPEEPKYPRFSEVAEEELKFWFADVQERGEEELVRKTAGEALKEGVVCNELMAYHLAYGKRFLIAIGIPEDAIRFREQVPGERAHYSKETWDMEVFTEKFGWVEVAGFAYRTDYDLSRHSKSSNSDLTVFVQEGDEGRRVMPHVVEPSYGIDRPFYCLLEHTFTEENGRSYFKLKKDIAPIGVEVFPLVTEGGLSEKAVEVVEKLREGGFMVLYDDSGSIGRRYARADEVGVPYCITTDHQTLEDSTVTIRDRDTRDQIRVPIEELSEILLQLIHDKIEFEKAGEPVH